MNRPAGSRLLIVGLDGFDPGVAASLRRDGKLPNLSRLEDRAHRFRLDPGVERYTGLAWEQFSSGLTPSQARRWSANTIDTERYLPDQPTTRLAPFTEKLDVRTATFDVPYFDLERADRARGMAAWGSHDPGVPEFSRPAELSAEISGRFGAYPAPEYTYGHVWPNAERTAEMGRALVDAVNLRSSIARWLFAERLADWDLAITVISEYHSAVEAFWHGWEETHPLYRLTSAAPARIGLIGVYEAGDRMLGSLREALPDASMLVFGPHGMGTNFADVAGMLLLPELLYRHSTGKVGFEPNPAWTMDGAGCPELAGVNNWSDPVNERLSIAEAPSRRSWRTGFRRTVPPKPHHHGCRLDWMPAARYRAAWPGMTAYAIPAYYDGRVRINLQGRESFGRVPVGRYSQALDEVAAVIRDCRDPVTDDRLRLEIERHDEGDPRQRDPTDADLIVRFQKDYYAFRHPRLGLIGPAPCRRPGGHTGGTGVGYFLGPRGRNDELGTFPYLELPDAVAVLMGCGEPGGGLGKALLGAESRSAYEPPRS